MRDSAESDGNKTQTAGKACVVYKKKLILSFGGIHVAGTLGMCQLQLAAERGTYPKPFAKVMLALTELRERNCELARQLFAELHEQFPKTSLFTSELEKLR